VPPRFYTCGLSLDGPSILSESSLFASERDTEDSYLGRHGFIMSPVVAILHLNVHNATLLKTGVEAPYGPWKDVEFVEFRGMEEDAENHQGPL
jgi:hypothetical protein